MREDSFFNDSTMASISNNRALRRLDNYRVDFKDHNFLELHWTSQLIITTVK